MQISVVTVCRNSEKTLADTLASFLRQTHRDKELVLIDGLSTDRTLDIARSYKSDAIKIFSEKDGGIYDAMNKGLRLFSGDAVGFLNSDDTFHDETALSGLAEYLTNSDIVYGDQTLVADQRSKRIVRMWRGGKFDRRLSFKLGWVPPHPTFYVRRAVVDEIGGFDLRYGIASDYDFMLRAMARSRFRVAYIPRLLVDYQIGGASSNGMRNILQGNLECLDSRRRHFGSGPIDAAFFLRPLRRIFQLRSVVP